MADKSIYELLKLAGQTIDSKSSVTVKTATDSAISVTVNRYVTACPITLEKGRKWVLIGSVDSEGGSNTRNEMMAVYFSTSVGSNDCIKPVSRGDFYGGGGVVCFGYFEPRTDTSTVSLRIYGDYSGAGHYRGKVIAIGIKE